MGRSWDIGGFGAGLLVCLLEELEIRDIVCQWR